MHHILYFSFSREKYAITLELVGNVIYSFSLSLSLSLCVSLSLDYSKWFFLSAGDA